MIQAHGRPDTQEGRRCHYFGFVAWPDLGGNIIWLSVYVVEAGSLLTYHVPYISRVQRELT